MPCILNVQTGSVASCVLRKISKARSNLYRILHLPVVITVFGHLRSSCNIFMHFDVEEGLSYELYGPASSFLSPRQMAGMHQGQGRCQKSGSFGWYHYWGRGSLVPEKKLSSEDYHFLFLILSDPEAVKIKKTKTQ